MFFPHVQNLVVFSDIVSFGDQFKRKNKYFEFVFLQQIFLLSGQCVPDKWICNGKPDLLDGLDEQNCKERICEIEYQICDNNKCVSPDQVCDGKLNCIDGIDEANCTECFNKCDGVCIAHSQVCDGHFDCKDKSDEENCESWECSEDFWKCDDGKCIIGSSVCDTFPDCADTSDEIDCESRNCPRSYWKCADQRQCVPYDKVCDHITTCQDASDETLINCNPSWNCSAGMFTCTEQHIQCLPLKYVCDGKDEPFGCGHSDEDEENCEHWNCTEGYWKCSDNKQCVRFAEVCDDEDHCNKKSDENNCERFTCAEQQWKCVNTRDCIETSQVCDGLSDCTDDSDEKGNRNYEKLEPVLLFCIGFE